MPHTITRFVTRATLLGVVVVMAMVVDRSMSAAVSPPTNAAPLYDEAARLLASETGALDGEAWTRLAEVLEGGPITAAARADLARVRAVLDLAHEAASIRAIDRGLDRSAGFGMQLSHLNSMRQLTRLMLADAAVRLADGDAAGAARALGTTLAMGSHIAQDRLVLSTLVASSTGANSGMQLQRAIDVGAIDAEQAAVILRATEGLAPTDPFGFVGALDGEREMVQATVRGVVDGDPRFDEWSFNEAGDDDGEGNDGQAGNETLLKELGAVERLYAEVGDALGDPNPETAKRRIAAIEARLASGEGGGLGQMIGPVFSAAFEMKLRAEAALVTPLAQLRAIASGESSPADFTNAATWLRQAARAAERLDRDEQSLIEAVRIAPDALNDELKEQVRTLLDRTREELLTPLLRAADAGLCRFRRPEGRQVEILGITDYSRGVRGAVRALLADAMLAASESADAAAPSAAPNASDVPPTALDRVNAALKIVELIASDAALAHAVLATAIAGDVVATAPEIVRRAAPDRAALASLRAAVEAIDRTDPFGHRRGLRGDRLALTRVFGSADITRARRRELADRLDPNQTFALLVAIQSSGLTDDSSSCGRIDGGPLASLADLVDGEACAAVFALRSELVDLPVLRAERDTPPAVRDPLGGRTLPVVVDATQLEHRSVGLIDELDQLVRRAAAAPVPD